MSKFVANSVSPLVWLNIWYRGYFLSSSCELTRLDSITKAPVIHHFSESISGVMTVRAFRNLDFLVVDNGENWSVGHRQLLRLGRVMLKRSRLLFMDEGTASLDSQTDAMIQKIIREDFAVCTIISIAHRIPTVMDCDRVLVVDSGRAEEFDKPSNLLQGPSLFGALVQEYANRSSGL